MFQILFSQRAESDYNFITKNWSQASVRKVIKLLAEIEQNPRVGTGKPEQLKHYKDKEIWSRRIDEKNRLIYSIDNDEVLVILISMIGHYADKWTERLDETAHPSGLTHDKSELVWSSTEEIKRSLRGTFYLSTEEWENSSELWFLSSEVSFHSSEVLSRPSVENFRFLVSYGEIPR